jgi:hypothetical protein
MYLAVGTFPNVFGLIIEKTALLALFPVTLKINNWLVA